MKRTAVRSSYETEWRRKHIKDEDAIGLSFVQG